MNNLKKVLLPILGVILLFIYKYLNKNFGFAVYCPFYLLTGFYCPGCGITRMLFSLLEGNVIKAFWYNPLLFITLVAYFLYKIITLKKRIIIKEKYYYMYIVILIIYGILRNLPFFINTMPE